jgi:very-short-patch-repair endonuclease
LSFSYNPFWREIITGEEIPLLYEVNVLRESASILTTRTRLPHNNKLTKYSQNLRCKPTEAERKLWSRLRLKQLNCYQFHRQKVIGKYIVDFCSPALKLVIEVDGSPHYSDEGIAADKTRDKYLKDFGLKVLRFNDNEVLTNISGVVENILENMEKQ